MPKQPKMLKLRGTGTRPKAGKQIIRRTGNNEAALLRRRTNDLWAKFTRLVMDEGFDLLTPKTLANCTARRQNTLEVLKAAELLQKSLIALKAKAKGNRQEIMQADRAIKRISGLIQSLNENLRKMEKAGGNLTS